MVEIGDDLGAQQNLLISPKMYRTFIKPAERELYRLIHEKAPHAALFRHTDGAVFEVIPDLLEVGVNVLNPTQTSAKGMDAARIKAAFGTQITFHGTVEGVEGDVSVDYVVNEVKRRIDEFAPGGGFVLSTCNHMIDVRPELIMAMFETAREYGRYA
jgi:uroporphyrinogen decarboxylase